jgi:hypothetical protein
MNKTASKILLLVVLIVALVGCLYWRSKVGAPSLFPNTNNPASQAVKFDTSKIAVASFKDTSSDAFEIYGKYPTGVVGADYIKGQLDAKLAQFKVENDPARFSSDELGTFGPRKDHPYSFITEYKAYASGTYLTHRMDYYTYTGGAHGSTIVETYTYDASGKKIEPTELFIDAAAVGRFSELVKAKALALPDMDQVINTEWLADSAGPDATNFKAFAFDGSYLRIIFQQYAIAPYAAGIIEVPIPLTELTGILKPEFLK